MTRTSAETRPSPLASHLGRRLLATFLAVSLAAIALVTAAAVIGTSRGFDNQQHQTRAEIAGDVADTVARAYRAAGGWSTADVTLAQQEAQSAGARLIVFPGTSGGGARTMGPGMMSGLGAVTAPVVVDGTTVGTVRLAFGSPATTARDVAWTWIGVAAVVAVLLAVLASWYATSRLVRPLERVAGTARRFTAGDRQSRVGDLGAGEIGDLGRAIDEMADEVVRSDTSRRRAAANAAHELRTPVASLRAGLEELNDGLVEPQPELIAALHDQTLRLGRIVDDLAALAAVEDGTLTLIPQRVPLAEIAAAEVAAMEPTARAAQVSLTSELTPADANGDADRLRQIVRNLLANAVRYCRPGDSVMVSVQPHGAMARLQVADTGPGIAPDELPHVFDRLWRGSGADRGAGSGIGLWVVSELVRAHDGSVTVDSDGHSGTTFTVDIPTWGDR